MWNKERMKKITPESQVLRSCIAWLYWKKIYHFRLNTGAYKTETGQYVKYGLPGASDILALIRGVLVCIEVKSAKGKLSPNQIAFKEAIEKNGGVYIVARSPDDLERELKPLLS